MVHSSKCLISIGEDASVPREIRGRTDREKLVKATAETSIAESLEDIGDLPDRVLPANATEPWLTWPGCLDACLVKAITILKGSKQLWAGRHNHIMKSCFNKSERPVIDGVPGVRDVLYEVNIDGMETATIEQIHRVKQLRIRSVDKLPPLQRLSHDQGLTRTCAFKEFRFEPPFVATKKRREKKLPPIPENMLPKRHNSFDEDPDDEISEIPPVPSLTISPAFFNEKVDERSLSVEVQHQAPPTFQTREFTFPESSGKRHKKNTSHVGIVPALTPRNRDTPVQAKIEKLAKQKRRERAKRAIEKRYEKKPHNMTDFPASKALMAFKSKRDSEPTNNFNLKDTKHLPFKQMLRPIEDVDRPKIHPRLYTKIVDSIYTYTKGANESKGGKQPYERLMVTPVTAKDDIKDELSRQPTRLPPIT